MLQTHQFDTLNALSQYAYYKMTAVIHNVDTNILFQCSPTLTRVITSSHILPTITKDSMISKPFWFLFNLPFILFTPNSFIYRCIYLYNFIVLMHLCFSSGCLAGSSPALSIGARDRCRCDFSTRSDEFYFYFFYNPYFVLFFSMFRFLFALSVTSLIVAGSSVNTTSHRFIPL